MDKFPRVLIVEPTNRCNLRCPTCHTGRGILNRSKYDMNLNEFKCIVDQVKQYVKKILLYYQGEPFLNKKLLDMIQYAVANDIQSIVSTNGEFFNSKEYCLKVISSGLKHLIICLDGADQDTLSKYRVGSKFSNIIRGIRWLIESRQTSKIKIELQFIIMKHNEFQRDQMKLIANDLGVDIYSEKTIGIDINDSCFQQLAEQFVPVDSRLSRYCLKNGKYFLKGRITKPCSQISKMAVVLSDGTVLPCCYDFYSEFAMGNLLQQDFESIWSSIKYQQFRDNVIKSRETISICKTCSEGRTEIYV